MKEKIEQFFVAEGIFNHRFRRIFIKNWLLVFLCILLPMTAGVCIIHRNASAHQLEEIDAGIYRNADNSVATLYQLLEESCALLQRDILNEQVRMFLQMEVSAPPSYEHITVMQDVWKLVKAGYRENLHYSIDVYSSINNRLISSRYAGQSYAYVKDKTLVDTFRDYTQMHTVQNTFATTRVVSQGEDEETHVISIYQTRTPNERTGFTSLSIDVKQLLSYFSQNNTESVFLLLDGDGKVVLDTSGMMNGEILDFHKEYEDSQTFTYEMNGQRMRVLKDSFPMFGWSYLQMIPLIELRRATIETWLIVLQILFAGTVLGVIISYWVTRKLFRPVSAILYLLEEPENKARICDENDEYRYLLTQILELFEKNITLETSIAERTLALRSARAKTLQNQMTPHFLNNILQCINWLAIRETKKEDSRTSQAILLLADVIRMGKEQNTNFTTVDAEVDYTRKYVELEKLRHGDGIRCIFQIDPQVRTWKIPCLSLQVLVENAVIHGLQPVNADGTIYIVVESQDGKKMHICVEDTGVGIRQAEIDRIRENLNQEYIYLGKNLGLTNLFQRFRLLYGDRYSYRIENSVHGGTRISIDVEDPGKE